jgi:hypothetical protein
LQALLVAGGTLVLTSIWWLPILLRFGISPFLSAAQTSLHDYTYLAKFFILPFSDEPYLTIIMVFAIIGIVISIAKNELLLPLFYIVPIVIEPRNAANVNAIPISMLASIAFCQLILPGLAALEEKRLDITYQSPFQSRSGKVFIVYSVAVMFVGMLYFSIQLASKRVSEENLKAFEWVSNNTPADSQFLVITGNTDLFADCILEWFPAMTNRVSLTTIQGREWLDGSLFLDHVNELQSIQRCTTESSTIKCAEIQAKKLGLKFDYIYIAIGGDSLVYELLNQAGQYQEVYRMDR